MEGFIGEVRLFGGNFAPRNWAFCNGQLLEIAQFQELFAIINTTYGGDGRTTFALPDIRGRAVTHEGRGDGLSQHNLGKKYGEEENVMNVSNMPGHNHTGMATYMGQADGTNGDTSDPTNAFLAKAHNNNGELNIYDFDADPDDRLDMGEETVNFTVANAGSGTPFNNMQPTLVSNYIICLTGIFPSRS